MPIRETTTYCCKKWVSGELKKFYSRRPCAGGAVQCSDPDPPRSDDTDIIGPGDGIDIGDREGCRQKCREQYGRDKTKLPGSNADLQRCLARCGGGTGVDGDGVTPCAGGHELPMGASQCQEGFTLKTIEGRRWCCPDTGPGVGESPCGTGGYQLTSEVGFAGGAGQGKAPWAEVPGTERSSEWEGHMVWSPSKGAFINIQDPEGQTFDIVCRKGFVRKQDSEGNTWCCPEAGNGDGDGIGGEFQWGEGLQGLLARIQERANYLLDYPRGLTPQERQGVINYAIESVKSGERGQLQSSRDLLARRGLLGSGFEFEEAGRIQRETRGRETQVRREFGIDELDRRFQELMGTTGMVQGLTGTLMQGEQIPEILSGARRSEGQAAINSLLAFFGGSMGGQNNQYINAIINQLMGGQGGDGAGMMDWLPWILTQTDRTRV